jgi:hypothetical protein
MHRLAALTLALFFLSLPPAHARRLETWSYDRLLKEADVVVIATAVSSKDSGETFKEKDLHVDFLGVETTFSVEAILKGKVEGDKLKVLHYRLKKGVLVDNGPLLVSFRTQGIEVNLKHGHLHLEQPSYLLFLKKRKDGRYEAVSGQIDPRLCVREMYRPLPRMMEKHD